MIVVVVALDCRVLHRSVNTLDLAVCPRLVGLGQAVLDAVGVEYHVEAHVPGIDGVPVAGMFAELDTPLRPLPAAAI